jgi:hypothetical protein
MEISSENAFLIWLVGILESCKCAICEVPKNRQLRFLDRAQKLAEKELDIRKIAKSSIIDLENKIEEESDSQKSEVIEPI